MRRSALLATFLFLLTSQAWPKAYVSLILGEEKGDGSPEHPFKQINQALSAGFSEIEVWPTGRGQAYDWVRIEADDVKVYSLAGPRVMLIQGFTIASTKKNVEIRGFSVLGDETQEAAVYADNYSEVRLRNSILSFTPRVALTLDYGAVARVENCVFYQTSGAVYMYWHKGFSCFGTTLFATNCIFCGNPYVVKFNSTEAHCGRAHFDFCYLENNETISNWLGVTTITNKITDPVYFVDPERGCFQLAEHEGVSLRHKGHPGKQYQNPDGTRNDLGAFGGPFAVPYATRPELGAEIIHVNLEPVTVQEGDEIHVEVIVRGVK